MNKGELILAAGEAIGRCTDHTHNRYHLMLRKGTLYCIPALDCCVDDTLVIVLTLHQLEQGLSDSEWSRVGDKLVEIYERLTL